MGEVSKGILRTGDKEEGPSFEEKTERKGWAILSLQSPVELCLGAGGPERVQLQLMCRCSPV